MNPLANLTAAIQAVCPIDGASASGSIPKDQWEVWYRPEATPEQIAAAQLVIQNFDWAATQAAIDARKSAILSATDRNDMVARLRTATPAQIDNWVEANLTSLADARTIMKALLKFLARF